MSAIVIDDLSPAERLDLIGALWDSLDERDVPVSAAQRDELDRRLAAADADEASDKTWEQVEASLKRGSK
jgi:putative addiction module component (TIGR02574 family)